LVKLALELWTGISGKHRISSLNNGIDDRKEVIQYRLDSGGASGWGQDSSSAGGIAKPELHARGLVALEGERHKRLST
jgi:hypothetical protein